MMALFSFAPLDIEMSFQNVVSVFSNALYSQTYIKNGDEFFFKAKDVCDSLGYEDSDQAIRKHVDDELKVKLGNITTPSVRRGMGLSSITIFLTEAGLYELISSSKLPGAKEFRIWIFKELVPAAIKKRFTLDRTRRDFKIENENDLHKKVVDLIRAHRPELIIIAGLGENQITSELRLNSWHKGYLKGQPDLIINNFHKYYSGFCIEFKNPKGTGVLQESQAEVLKRHEENGYKILISHDYDEIILAIIEYCRELRYPCLKCNKKFKSRETLKSHKEGLKHAG